MIGQNRFVGSALGQSIYMDESIRWEKVTLRYVKWIITSDLIYIYNKKRIMLLIRYQIFIIW